MHFHDMVMPLLVTGASLFPRMADAQTTDSVPFHRGQWGAEFHIDNGFAGAGALHFTSPTRAWLLDTRAAYVHTSSSGTGVPSGNVESVALDLGTRTYHPFGRRLYRLSTFGLSFSYRRETSSVSATTRAVGGGPFASLGATWLVTPHLGIGAMWRVAISYTHGTASGAGTSATVDDVRISLGGVVLAGQLYF